jgi:membrane protein DedA with SNARE-associated domain
MDKVSYLLRMLTGFSLAHAAPLTVFLLMVPESACIPVPSEVTLLAAGFAVHTGRMSFAVAVAAATAGNLAGSLIAYWFGRLTTRWRLWGWAYAGLSRCDVLFARRGARAVFTARLMPLARTFVSLPAGHARIPIARFAAMTAIGCALWASGFVLAGTLLGAGWQGAGHALRVPLLLLGAGAGVLILLKGRQHKPLGGQTGDPLAGRHDPPERLLPAKHLQGLKERQADGAARHGDPDRSLHLAERQAELGPDRLEPLPQRVSVPGNIGVRLRRRLEDLGSRLLHRFVP